MLQYLTLPALCHFRLCHGYHPATWVPVVFLDLVRSGCQLESFTILDDDLAEDDIVAESAIPSVPEGD